MRVRFSWESIGETAPISPCCSAPENHPIHSMSASVSERCRGPWASRRPSCLVGLMMERAWGLRTCHGAAVGFYGVRYRAGVSPKIRFQWKNLLCLSHHP